MNHRIVHELPGRLRIRLDTPKRPAVDKAQVEAHFRDFAGVSRIAFNPRTRNLMLHYDGNAVTRKALLERVDAIPVPSRLRPRPATELEKKKKTVFRSGSSLLLGPLLIPPTVRPLITLAGAVPIFRRGVASVWKGRLDVNVLDASAIGAAMLTRDFLTASVISFLLKLGDYLEEWTRGRFRRQLSEMFHTGEEWAWILRDGQEVRVRLNEIRKGDTVIVRRGNLIPVDGIVVEGEALVNQASLTGESLPVMRRKGKSVYAGTAVEEGNIHVQTVNVGPETRAARVVRVIEEAETLKAETQSYADRLADRAVPYSFALSGLTYALTGNVNRAAAVLLVDYSCAVKLSTPLAILASLAGAARHNVLIKGGRYLEKLAQADAFILDKTGTLTEAAPEVADVVAFKGYGEDYILKLAACAEEHFPHPVATAVVKYTAQRGLTHEEEHTEVEYIVAHGIVSRVNGAQVLVGSRHFIREDKGVKVPPEADSVIDAFARKGHSVLYVAMEDKLVGLIAVRDPLRREARSFIGRLREAGIKKIVMVTGDNEATAKTVARELGIADFYAQAFPETKVKVIQGLQKEGYIVAMVGDGVNDSPALSYADVGISMKQGADIAKEASDVLLMEGTLGDILEARRIARDAIRLIEKNYRIIIGINSAAILMAIAGAVSPIFSAATHNLSTIGVALLALKPLRRKGKRRSFASEPSDVKKLPSPHEPVRLIC